MNKKNRMLYFRSVAVALLAVVIILDVLFAVLPDKGYSAVENRNLEQLPGFSIGSFISGRFEEHFEDYVADQFPGRVLWIRLKAVADRLMGKTESNGVYLGSDGYLIQDFTSPNAEGYTATMAAVRSFAQRYPDVNKVMLLAPTAVTILKDKLPALAPSGNEGAFMDRVAADVASMGIEFVDTRAALAAEKDAKQLYYRTDHHWTTDGAYIAYRELAARLGIRDADRAYTRALISDSFSGTLTASSGFRMDETDEVYAYLPDNEDFHYIVEYKEEGEKASSFWKTAQLETRDKYTVFFGGNHADIRIRTDLESDRVLLVLKDSYANCLLPFLIPDFSQIIVIDPRYYTGELGLLMESEKVTDVLLLYNATTFAADTALKRELA